MSDDRQPVTVPGGALGEGALPRGRALPFPEPAALGFLEGADLPWPRAYGLALRRLYEQMPIRLDPDRLLHPCEPLPLAQTMESHGRWHATALIVDCDHNRGLRVNRDVAEARKREFPAHAAAIDALVAAIEPRLPHFGGYTHSNPDIRRIVGEGFGALEAELAAALAETPDDPLLLALTDYAAGVRAFWRRTHEALVAGGHPLAAAFGTCFLAPATTFVGGLLAVHFAWMLDFCDSLGRFDQVLGPLFEAELDAGTLDLDLARRLLDEVWHNFERFNGWNLQLGGWTADGRDGVNRLTHECLEACRRNRLRRPNVAFRVTSQTPPAALAHALEVLGAGSGRPALYNDDLYLESLLGLDLGLTRADACEIGFGGCTETMIGGLSNVGSLEGELNLAALLEATLQRGPAVLADEATLLAALRETIKSATDAFAAEHDAALTRRFTEGDPKLYRTLFTRDCVANRRSFEGGGARYNWAVVSYQGIANLIDSLAALRSVVFEQRAVTPAELLAALAANFEGAEPLRRRLRAAPKFGNDDPRVDKLGREVIGYAWDCLLAHRTPRGGRYLPSCILFATYAAAGAGVGALPDGRRAFEPLTDSVGPVAGRDTHGPTAMLNSVAKLPLASAAGTPVLNMRFDRTMFASAAGLEAVAGLVRAFFDAGGMQIQLSVLDSEELRAAQREPEKYADLLVRIGGYSEYFNRLGKGLQESVIERTEHGVG